MSASTAANPRNAFTPNPPPVQFRVDHSDAFPRFLESARLFFRVSVKSAPDARHVRAQRPRQAAPEARPLQVNERMSKATPIPHRTPPRPFSRGNSRSARGGSGAEKTQHSRRFVNFRLHVVRPVGVVPRRRRPPGHYEDPAQCLTLSRRTPGRRRIIRPL